jgi:hypothetical protein
MEQAEDAGIILPRTARLMRGNAKMVVTTMVILAVFGALLDGSIVGLIAQYANVFRVLGQLNLSPDGYRSPRIGAMLGQSILTTLGIVCGLVLPVVPGIILAVRWSIAVPVLLGEETGVIESLRRSWAETKGRFWPTLAASAVAFMPGLLIGIGARILLLGYNERAADIAASIAINCSIIVLWYVSVAVYARRRMVMEGLDEVFA